MSAISDHPSRPPFELLPGGNIASSSWRWFCGSCAARPILTDALPSACRVCGVCGFGLLLQAAADEAPGPESPFLVVDASFAVQAVSKPAESFLGITEQRAVNRHVTELLIPADCSSGASADLALAISIAARGDGPAITARVSRASTFGERVRARISPCGPPPAALIVLS